MLNKYAGIAINKHTDAVIGFNVYSNDKTISPLKERGCKVVYQLFAYHQFNQVYVIKEGTSVPSTSSYKLVYDILYTKREIRQPLVDFINEPAIKPRIIV
jgi:hypothetical protein